MCVCVCVCVCVFYMADVRAAPPLMFFYSFGEKKDVLMLQGEKAVKVAVASGYIGSLARKGL